MCHCLFIHPVDLKWLDSKDGNALEKSKTKEETEGHLKGHKGVVGVITFAIHQVNSLFVPVQAWAILSSVQKFLLKLDTFSHCVGQAVPETQVGANEDDNADDSVVCSPHTTRGAGKEDERDGSKEQPGPGHQVQDS